MWPPIVLSNVDTMVTWGGDKRVTTGPARFMRYSVGGISEPYIPTTWTDSLQEMGNFVMLLMGELRSKFKYLHSHI